MASDQFTDCVRLTDIERQQLYNALELTERDPGDNSKRKFQRVPYYGHEVPFTLHDSNGREVHYYTALTRNLSESGIALLHGGFAYTGACCEVKLSGPDGQSLRIEGIVAHCRLVKGRVHELGIKFDDIIDPSVFVGCGTTDSDPESITGDVLVLDDQPTEQKLLAHHLKATRINLSTASTCAECIDAIGASAPDLLICDLELGGDDADGVEALRRIRAAGYTGPILAATGHASAEKVRGAVSLGAVGVLLKPFDVAKLHHSLAQHLSPAAHRRAA